MKNHPAQRILITKVLSSPQREAISKSRYEFQEIPVITITHCLPDNLLETCQPDLKQKQSAIAFTSQNAVDAISSSDELLKFIRNIPCFAVGTQTAEALNQLGFSNVIAGEGNAVSLAEVIHQSGIKHVLHFCGNLRRDELSATLSDNEISYSEMVVYETTPANSIPKNLPDDTDFIFFMSPSAVDAFFTLGLHHVYDESVYIAIGQTTLKELLPRHVTTRVAREPSFESMIKACR